MINIFRSSLVLGRDRSCVYKGLSLRLLPTLLGASYVRTWPSGFGALATVFETVVGAFTVCTSGPLFGSCSKLMTSRNMGEAYVSMSGVGSGPERERFRAKSHFDSCTAPQYFSIKR